MSILPLKKLFYAYNIILYLPILGMLMKKSDANNFINEAKLSMFEVENFAELANCENFYGTLPKQKFHLKMMLRMMVISVLRIP